MKKIAFALVLLLAPLSAQAALNAYLKLKGGAQSTGIVIDSAHTIVSPRDAASGLPTGQRMHKPFTVSLTLTPDSPLKDQLKEGTTLDTLSIDVGKKGTRTFYVVELTDILISSVKAMGDGSVKVTLNTATPANADRLTKSAEGQ